jgi:hypothetical protein
MPGKGGRKGGRKDGGKTGERPEKDWRTRPDLNRGMEVLQTSALPLGYGSKTEAELMYQTVKARCNPVGSFAEMGAAQLRRAAVLHAVDPLIVSVLLQAGTFYYVEITRKGWSDTVSASRFHATDQQRSLSRMHSK